MWFSVVCTLIDNDARHNSGRYAVNAKPYFDSLIRLKLESWVIFLDQSQFFATHSNQ